MTKLYDKTLGLKFYTYNQGRISEEAKRRSPRAPVFQRCRETPFWDFYI